MYFTALSNQYGKMVPRLDTRGAYPIVTAYVKITECKLRQRNTEIQTKASKVAVVNRTDYVYLPLSTH